MTKKAISATITMVLVLFLVIQIYVMKENTVYAVLGLVCILTGGWYIGVEYNNASVLSVFFVLAFSISVGLSHHLVKGNALEIFVIFMATVFLLGIFRVSRESRKRMCCTDRAIKYKPFRGFCCKVCGKKYTREISGLGVILGGVLLLPFYFFLFSSAVYLALGREHAEDVVLWAFALLGVAQIYLSRIIDKSARYDEVV